MKITPKKIGTAAVLIILALGVVSFIPGREFRVLGALLLTLIMPGFPLIRIFVKSRLTYGESFIVSLGLSMAVVPMLYSGLNAAGIELSSRVVFFALVAWIGVTGAVSMMIPRPAVTENGEKVLNITSKWYVLGMTAGIILLIKIIYAALNYRYVQDGFDSARVLEAINHIVGTGMIGSDIAPRVSLHYLAAGFRLLSGIHQADALLMPFFASIMGGGGMVYLLGKEISKSSKAAMIGFVLFALAVFPDYITTSTEYTFVLAPLLWWSIYKYINREFHILGVGLIAFGGFLGYEPLLSAALLSSGAVMFLYMCIALKREDSLSVRHYARFFFILPAVLMAGYLMSYPLVIESYRDWFSYANRALGFFLWRGAEALLWNSFLVLIGMHILLGVTPWFSHWLRGMAGYINEILNRCMRGTSRIIHSKIVRLFLGGVSTIVVLDMFTTLRYFYEGNEVGEDSLAQSFVGIFLYGEIWEVRSLGFYPYLFLVVGIMSYWLFSGRSHRLDRRIWLLIAPLFIIFVAAITPNHIAIGNLYLSKKGLNGIQAIVFALAGLIAWEFIKSSQRKKVHDYVMTGISGLIIYSFFTSILAIDIGYPLSAKSDVIEASKWMEENQKSDRVFILYPDKFVPDKGAMSSKFYALSFIYSTIDFELMREVNIKKMVMENFDAFQVVLERSDTQYIVLAKPYGLDYLNQKVISLGEVIYREGGLIIIEVEQKPPVFL